MAAQGKCWPIPRNPPGVGVVGTSPGQILGHAMPPRPFHAISLPSSGPYTSGPYPGLPLSTYEFSEAHRLWVISLRGGGGIKTLPQSPLLLTSEGQRAGGDPQLPRPGPSRGGGWRGPTPDNPLAPPPPVTYGEAGHHTQVWPSPGPSRETLWARGPLPAQEDGCLTFQVPTTLQVPRAQPPWEPCPLQSGREGSREGPASPPAPSPASVSPTLLSSVSRGEFPCKILFEQSFPPLQTLYKPVIQPARPVGSQSGRPGLQSIYSAH